MGVEIHEAGRHDLAFGVENFVRRARIELGAGDFGDLAVFDPDVAAEARVGTGAVNDGTVQNDRIEL
jgi:hypothetical protein